ncbi:hypothetical protein BD414DRAFT_28411 [Trametes punicea]|nr:hypothetical protein BD414DRAFT_28411 [Trametes punicea]
MLGCAAGGDLQGGWAGLGKDDHRARPHSLEGLGGFHGASTGCGARGRLFVEQMTTESYHGDQTQTVAEGVGEGSEASNVRAAWPVTQMHEQHDDSGVIHRSGDPARRVVCELFACRGWQTLEGSRGRPGVDQERPKATTGEGRGGQEREWGGALSAGGSVQPTCARGAISSQQQQGPGPDSLLPVPLSRSLAPKTLHRPTQHTHTHLTALLASCHCQRVVSVVALFRSNTDLRSTNVPSAAYIYAPFRSPSLPLFTPFSAPAVLFLSQPPRPLPSHRSLPTAPRE